MTAVVQSVPIQPINGATSWTFTIAGTTATNLLVVKAGVQQFGGANPTSVAVTDNGSGNSWATAVFKAGTGGDRFAFICYCLSVSAGTTSVTVTPNTGTFYGSSGIEEVSGGTWALDQTGSAVSTISATNTATCTSVDLGTTDFVAAAVQVDGGQSNEGISDPPTGYTSSSVEQDDGSFAGSETCYRVNSAALTNTVTWTYTVSASVGLPCCIASFKVSGGGGNVTAALTGSAITSSSGLVVPVHSQALTGAAIASSAGLETPNTSKVLTGIAATFSAGLLSPSSQIPLNGQRATFATGSISAGGNVTQALTGQSASFVAGNLTPSLSLGLLGSSVTASAGLLTPSTSVTVSGQSFSLSNGTLIPNLVVGMLGQGASCSPGSTIPGSALGLTGQSITSSAGSDSPSTSVPLVGQQVTFGLGIITATGGTPIIVDSQPLVQFISNTGFLKIHL